MIRIFQPEKNPSQLKSGFFTEFAEKKSSKFFSLHLNNNTIEIEFTLGRVDLKIALISSKIVFWGSKQEILVEEPYL